MTSEYTAPPLVNPTNHFAPAILTALGEDASDPATPLGASLSGTYGRQSTFNPGAGGPIAASLESGGASFGIQVIGDSTGNDATEWPYLLGAYLAANYPAWTVRHRLFVDATSTYAAPTVIQSGAGGDRRVTLNGGAASFFYLPDVAAFQIVGDLDVSAHISLVDWTPATSQAIAARFGGAGARAWRFWVDATTGKLALQASSDGTNLDLNATSTVAPTVVDGAVLWVRFTLDVDNGAAGKTVTFYTSTDGATWTQLGSTVVAAGVYSTFANAGQQLELGTRSTGSDLMNGSIYEIRIRSGINGPTVAPVLPEQWRPSSGTIVYEGAPVLDIINASVSGASVAYLNDATRLPKMTPNYGTLVTFFSCSHNDSGALGTDYLTRWDTLLTLTKARLPISDFVVIGQNPRTAPATFIAQHAARRGQLMAWALRNGGRFLDVYRVFAEDPRGLPALVNVVDGIHPSVPDGSDLWATTVQTFVDRSA